MRLNDIIIVLARPSEPGNTGAVCRAMKNMGLGRLRIAAAEYNPEKYENMEEKLLSRAIHAADVWDNAEHFATLKEALADCAISIGTSRRRGRRRKSITLTPWELAEFLRPRTGKAALVFGNERTGLDREELELCNMASHVPVNPEFPSINLSHAVQIYSYEFYRHMAEDSTEISLENGTEDKAAPRFSGPAPVPGHWVPMSTAEIEAQVKKTSYFLESKGFYKYPGREEQERFLNDIMARAGLTLNEGRYLCDIIAKSASMEILNTNHTNRNTNHTDRNTNHTN